MTEQLEGPINKLDMLLWIGENDPQLAEKVKAWAVQVLREHKQGEKP